MKPPIALSFQSYQGSILTANTSSRDRTTYSFQSYQGSILTEDPEPRQIIMNLSILSRFNFNLNNRNVSLWIDGFQSYQGSILTMATE